MKIKNDTKLSRVEDKIKHDVRKYLDKMGCHKKTTVEFSDRVDKNSAQTYLDTGLIVFNKDYVELNETYDTFYLNWQIHLFCKYMSIFNPLAHNCVLKF
jgi:hypothetical protein